jgi:hypothetical protein
MNPVHAERGRAGRADGRRVHADRFRALALQPVAIWYDQQSTVVATRGAAVEQGRCVPQRLNGWGGMPSAAMSVGS